MMNDVLASFLSPPAAPVSAVSAAGAAIQLGQIVDLLGVGVGNPPPSIIGIATLFGMDPGIGIWVPEVMISIGTSFTTSNSATANFQFQYAPDTAVTFQPGTWETAAETGAKPASELAAFSSSALGFLRMKVPPTPPSTQTPRYARMMMQVLAATSFTAGTIAAAIIVQGRDDLTNKQASNNYVVA